MYVIISSNSYVINVMTEVASLTEKGSLNDKSENLRCIYISDFTSHNFSY